MYSLKEQGFCTVLFKIQRSFKIIWNIYNKEIAIFPFPFLLTEI